MTDSSEQNNITPIKGYVIFTQFILEVIGFEAVAIFLGLYLDKLLNTKFIFLIVFILLFSFVPIYNLAKRVLLNNEVKNSEKK